MDGDALIAASETKEGLDILREILSSLSDGEFVDAIRGLLGVDEPSDAVAAVVADEGSARVNKLIDNSLHLFAVTIGAASCSPEAFLSACRAGLDAHKDPVDPVRIQILELFGDCPELVNQLRASLES